MLLDSKSASEVLVGSLLGSTYFNYLENKGCICILSAEERKHWEYLEIKVITRRKELVDMVGINRLR